MEGKEPEKKQKNQKRKLERDGEIEELKSTILKMQQEKLVTQRLLAAAYYFDQNDSKWRCKSENGCKVGDWVLEVSIGVKARFQHGQQSLLNAVGRLLFVGKGCLSCLDQRHEKDETDVDEENTKGDGFHHYAQDIYFLETPDGRLAHWSNCLFVSLDTIFMDSFNHKEDGTPYIPGISIFLFLSVRAM